MSPSFRACDRGRDLMRGHRACQTFAERGERRFPLIWIARFRQGFVHDAGGFRLFRWPDGRDGPPPVQSSQRRLHPPSPGQYGPILAAAADDLNP
jgi:hypothetical protein